MESHEYYICERVNVVNLLYIYKFIYLEYIYIEVIYP
jgi:hypothetical protein